MRDLYTSHVATWTGHHLFKVTEDSLNDHKPSSQCFPQLPRKLLIEFSLCIWSNVRIHHKMSWSWICMLYFMTYEFRYEFMYLKNMVKALVPEIMSNKFQVFKMAGGSSCCCSTPCWGLTSFLSLEMLPVCPVPLFCDPTVILITDSQPFKFKLSSESRFRAHCHWQGTPRFSSS